jgi:hypothetical protein
MSLDYFIHVANILLLAAYSIWFGSAGAEYAPSNAKFSDKNLITAKPLVGVDDAIRLLQRSIKSE